MKFIYYIRVFLTLLFLTALSAIAATATYDASLGTLPTAQGWQLRDQGGPSAFLTNNFLHIGPTPTGGDYSYQNTNVSVNFTLGFTMHSELRIAESTFGYGGAGYVLDAFDNLGSRVTAHIGNGSVLLTSGRHFDISSPVIMTTSNWVAYSVVVQNGVARLYANGTKIAQVNVYIESSNDMNWATTVLFGDVIGALTCTADIKTFGYTTAATYPPGVDESLLAWFPFSGNANDATGNGHNGIVYGARLTANRFGNPNSAYHFDANTNFISVASGGALAFNASSESYTVAAWIKLDAYTNRWGDLHFLSPRPYGINTACGYGLSIRSSASPNTGTLGNTVWDGSAPGITVGSPAPIPLTTWTFVALVVQVNATQTLYVNGLAVATNNIQGIGNTKGNLGDILIGAAWYPDGHGVQVFNGAVDDIRIYNRALSSNEIQQLYTSQTYGSVIANLVGLTGGFQPQLTGLRLDSVDQTTSGTSAVTFANVAAGAHTLRGYQNGGTPFGEEMWAIKSFALANGQSTNITLTRNLPYLAGPFVFKDQTTRQPITTTTLGQTVRIEVPVAHQSGTIMSCRLRMVFDQDQTGSFDYDLTNDTFAIVGPSGTNTAVMLWTPTNTGTFHAAYSVITDLGGTDGWTQTDSGNWFSHPALTVQPPPIPALVFDYCNPDVQIVLDWDGSHDYRMRVFDSLTGHGVAGASIIVTNSLTGQVLTNSTLTDSDGVVTVPITVPNGQADGIYDISFTAIKAGYQKSSTLHRTIQVQHNAVPTEFGITVITHGYARSGESAAPWMSELGCAILRKAKRGTLWWFYAETDTLTNITAAYESLGMLAGVEEDVSGEQVILFGWEKTADETFESPAGHAEAAGHQLYSLLVGGDPSGMHVGFVGPIGARKPLHIIGHSFGTVVISEAIQRLGLAGIEVEQMTNLDPHDWDEDYECQAHGDCGYLEFAPYLAVPCAKAAILCLLGDVDGRARQPDVHVWSNVIRADNYYETSGGQTPHGRPLFGALNTNLTSLHGFGDAPWTDFANTHSRVYAFYLGTIDPQKRKSYVDGIYIDPAWYQGGYETTGFVYSRLAGKQYPERFNGPTNERYGGDNLVSPPLNSQRNNANGKPDISPDPPSDIFNWSLLPDLFDAPTLEAPVDSEVPGYATSIEAPQDYLTSGQMAARLYLDLNGSRLTDLRTHLTYIPANAQSLAFELRGSRISGYGSEDRLVVKFNTNVLGIVQAVDFPTLSTLYQVSLTTNIHKSGIISFTLESGHASGSEAIIDNIRLGYDETPVISVAGSNGIIHDGQKVVVQLGSVTQGSAAPQQTITIKNNGGGTLTIANLQVTSGFTISGTPLASLAAGASGIFLVQMNTSALGSKSGNVTFTCNDPAQSSFSFPVSGQVIAPSTPQEIALLVSGVSITNNQTSPVVSIGSALISSAGPIQTFTIRNNGDQTLTVGIPTVPPGFVLASTPPASLPSGQSGNFSVRLDTTIAGTPFGDVSVPNNDSTKNPFTFRISGSVVPTTGALTLTLSPVEAVAAGAQWRVDGGAWQTNGATLSGLGASNHIVEFKDPPYWHAPSSTTVSLVAGQSRSLTRYYLPFSQPVLGQIAFLPSRSVQGNVSGDSGIPIVVERSMDLQSWSPISTNSAGSFNFYDYAANGNPQLFYRARYE